MATLQARKQILSEIQEAAKQLGLNVPTSLFQANLSDTVPLQMAALANLAGVLITDVYDWSFLQGVFPCVGDGVRTRFDLPPDISEITDNTGWSRAIRRPVSVLNAQQWSTIASWLGQNFYINPACRIDNDQMEFMSAPPAGDIVTFQYRKRNWVVDADDPLIVKDMCDKNGDVPMFDWMLMILAIKIKWLETKGMSTLGAQSDFNDRLGQLTSKDVMAPILTLSGPSLGGFRYLDNFYNTPDTGFGS